MSEPAPQKLPRTVVWLGVVSFLTDASSEMIYPLLPQFLTAVLGAGGEFVGLVEGVAETTASLLKLVSGQIADRMRRKKPLTVAGYTLSSLVRPIVAVTTAPWQVLAIRFADRVGKGLRTSPRDALVAAATPAAHRGAAYGYHRAMDNAGAVLGPLLGFALLRGFGVPMRWVFALAIVPALLAVAAVAGGVREAPLAAMHKTAAAAQQPASRIDPSLYRYLVVLGVFTLANSSDAFLLLRARSLGVSTDGVLLLWTMHNGVKAVLNRPLGALSDKIGRRRLILGGWMFYGLTYLGFGAATTTWHIWGLFALYSLYYAMVEGSERALVADLAGPEHRGRAFGWYNAVVGLVALPSSLLFGVLEQRWGWQLAFSTGALFAALAGLGVVFFVRLPQRA